MLTITSDAFNDDQWIPRKFAREGQDVSPPLAWSAGPPGTVEYALICDDPDAPRPEPWVHWVLFNIPATVTALPEGGLPHTTAGMNSYGERGYGGPMPPRGHGIHHYHFRIYALKSTIKLPSGADNAALLNAMAGQILDQGTLTGLYERK